MQVVEELVAAQDTSFRAVQRQLALHLFGSATSAGSDAALDAFISASEPPRLSEATLIESGPMRSRKVPGEPEVRFAAFLDGTQSSRIARYSGGIALIHGTVAAVVRARRDRRMVTWESPIIRHGLYAPRKHLDRATNEALDRTGIHVVDTSIDDAGPGLAVHPFALRDAAINRVRRAREAVEQKLAEQWCENEHDPLFIDGGLSGSERVAVSASSVGVVKSHRTLYAEGTALQTVLALEAGERSSVFRIAPAKRVPVASWYLRLRDAHARDPMWGLVRVEIAHPVRADEPRIGERADEVSRWILAEASPLSIPDARWDKMVYGVRDCEEFLEAIT
jgi:hypothetical protein